MRALRLFLPILLLVVATAAPAAEPAFVAADLARGAAAYDRIIRARQPKPDAQRAAAALRRARALMRGGAIDAAVPAFEAAIAAGAGTSEAWLALGAAQIGASRPNRQRAQFATYRAYQAAKTNGQRGRALHALARLYETARAFDRALAAMTAAVALIDDRGAQAYYRKLVRAYGFRVTDLRVEADRAAPRIVLEFSHDLATGADANPGDYVRIVPAVKAAFTADGRRLIIGGVANGAGYRVTVARGLLGKGARRTRRVQNFTVRVGDRRPSLGFRGGTYILPSHGGDGLPLISVNVDKAEIAVLRVNDRNLIDQINRGRIAKVLSGYDVDRIVRRTGERVWTGTLTIDGERNKQATTALSTATLFRRRRPGIYIVAAKPAGVKMWRYQDRATQWVLVSNIGLTTFRGADGLHVFARALDSARPIAGLVLRLFARNNTELGSRRTDAKGMASFAPGLLRGGGGRAPAALMAYRVPAVLMGNRGQGDFNFLDLTRPAFDLGDRGVAGRKAPGPVDAYLYTDRGVYRPGETVHLTALVRDDRARALADLPLLLKLIRPDGTEHRRYRLRTSQAGGIGRDLTFAKTDRTGMWSVVAYVDPKGKPVGRARFQLEDFVPERLAFTLAPERKTLVPGVDDPVTLEARYLYGAPAAALATEAELVLRRDRNPYPAFKDYRFGLAQERWQATRRALTVAPTDAEGRTRLVARLDAAPDTSLPLKAVLRVAVLEQGGRATWRSLSLPVRSRARALGIRPLFGDNVVETGQEAGFTAIAVDRDGARVATKDVTFALYRERYDYQWYYRSARWAYKVVIRDRLLDQGPMALAADRPARFARTLDWGRYRLELRDRKSGAATSLRFRVGWFTSGPTAGAAPDKLQVALDKRRYKAGETARVRIRPPFAGEALIAVAGDRLYETRLVTLPREGTVISIPVKADWGSGVYVTATAFRPGDRPGSEKDAAGSGRRGPARAIGLAWLGIDSSPRTLSVAITAPETIRPRRRVAVAVRVTAAAGKVPEAAYVTLAAVDDGILSLTDFKSPAPEDYFFAKRRLAVEIRDHYGRLITGLNGNPGRLRQGGDAAAKRHAGGLDAGAIRPVALFSGIVRLDAEGRARIPFDVPDFNGRLRLMAVAWDAERMGHGVARMTVRDPVVSQVSFARFLAPGDESRLSLRLDNVDGPAGDYRVAFAATGAARIDGAAPRAFALAPGQRRSAAFTLKGVAVGTARITMTLRGPGGFAIARRWGIAVRPAQAVTTRQIISRIAPGATDRLADLPLTDLVPGTARLTVSYSTAPPLGVPALLSALDRYPYGCVEQVTSRALPLLYVGDVARAIGLADSDDRLRERVQGAIDRVLAKQGADGGFGLWSALSDHDPWLSAYAMDFLTQARARDYPVPDFAYRRGLAYLREQVQGLDFRRKELPAVAYALYVLAQARSVPLSSLRYVYASYLYEIPTAVGRAQLGAALAAFGDVERARAAFAAAAETVTRPLGLADYGSPLRDLSARIYLASATASGGKRLPALVAELMARKAQARYTSTQEQAWMLLAARSLIGSGGPLSLAVDGTPLAPRRTPLHMTLDAGRIAAGRTVENRGKSRIWRMVTVTGAPAKALPAAANGMTVERSFYTLDGRPADLGALTRNQVLVAVIHGEATTGLRHKALIVDLLPAGLAIENTRLTHTRKTKDLSWLPRLSRLVHMELRDDRFVAAVDLDKRRPAFTAAYLVRATTPGRYRLPAVLVEDMVRPRYFARQALGRIVISAPQ